MGAELAFSGLDNYVFHLYQLPNCFVTFQPKAVFSSELANLCKTAI